MASGHASKKKKMREEKSREGDWPPRRSREWEKSSVRIRRMIREKKEMQDGWLRTRREYGRSNKELRDSLRKDK